MAKAGYAAESRDILKRCKKINIEMSEDRWLHEDIRCPRCGGQIYEDREWDLDEDEREYACILCGFRFWVNLSELRAAADISSPKNN